MNETATIIVAVLASNGLFALLQFLITRHDQKKNVKGRLLNLERDGLRTQLLLLLLMMPEEKKEILTIGEHYFVGLRGNWYMTTLFEKWCKKYGLKPDWFKGGQNAQN